MIRPIYDAIDASIVDYYLNHGRNRDLEKFLRLRSRSSSNISDLSEDARLNEKKRLSKSKSLETLTKLPDKSVEEEPAIPEPQPNPKDVVTNPKELPRVETSNIKVKLKQNKKEKNNFNVESIIEINFPANPPQMLNSNLHQPEFKPISYSTDTQTQQNESTSMEITNIEDPIQPVLHTPKIKPSSPKYITQKSMSPSSTENKQKLEWDSLGDLGYQMNDKFSLLTLNIAERKVLKEYFDQRGINFDDKVVVLKNDRSQMDPENDRQLRLGAIKKNKEKWQRIYQKYKDKYYEFEEPDAQSTPRIEMFNKKDEKSSQTSMVKITSKSTQADESPPILPPRKDVKTMTSKLENFEAKGFSMDSRSQLPEDQSFNTEIAESFSYIPGSSSSKLCSSAGNTRDSAKSLKDTISALLTTDTTNSTVSSILSEKKCRISSTNIFDEELREAIALLNSLLGSNMNSVLKKSLASKIIQKITKIQASTKGNNTDDMSSHNYSEVHPRTEPSTKCSSHSQGVSGVSTFSDPSKCKQSIPSKKTSSSSESRERVLKEFLQPMTYSEVDYQNHQIIRETKQKNTVNQKKNKNSDDQEGSTVSHNSVSKRNLPLLDFVRKEKQSQLNWIEKEILHLSNLRDLLAKNVDTSADTTMRPVQTSIALENKTSASNTKDSKSNYSSKSKSEESKKSKISESMVKRQKTQTEYSTQSNTSNKDTSNEKPKKEVKSGRFIDWDSHTNMKKIMKNRSKLETPDSDESIVSFINKRKDQFLEKYEKKKKQERHNNEALYTKPCSREAGDTDHYSEPIEKRNMQQQNMFSTTKNSPIINASTSLASSEVFVSSQSISIPVANSTNNTTTHHYDLNVQKQQLEARGTQTTDSIAKTKPIFERKLKENDQIFEKSTEVNTLSTNTQTKRVDQTRNHKQMQTSPKSIKYMLTFDRQNKLRLDRKFSSLPQEGIVSALKNTKELYNRINSYSLDNKKLEQKENMSDNTEIFIHQEDTVLENYLNDKRPDIWHKFEERKRCILQLKTLRIQRNEQRKKLLLLTSDTSLVGKLARLPPSPLSQQRIFSTKELKLQTQKQYQNLPEVQKKKEIENINNLKRKNRLMTDIFNKNLQRKVLKGQTFLSNSVNLLN